MKLGDTIFNGNAFKNIILNSKSYKRMILGTNLVWSYFGIAINAFRTRISADGGTYEAESILEDRLQEITPNLFDSASLVITPNGVKTSKLYSIKPNDGTGDLTVTRNTSATRVNESGVIVDVPANVARIDYSTGQPAILVEPQRTNLVYPSDIAITQVIAVKAQVYTLSFYGSGSVALSGAFSGSLIGTGTNNRVSLTFTPTAGNLTLTVNGSVTNWQLEAGSNATSLIKTISGSVTRNADVISKTGISSLIGQTQGTIFVDFNKAEIASSSGVLELGELGNEIVIWQNTAQLRFFVRVSGSIFGSRTYNIPDERLKIALTYQSNSYSVFLNGIKILDNISITSLSTSYSGIVLGNRFANPSLSALNSSINSAILWKTQLTDQQAIQLTTL